MSDPSLLRPFALRHVGLPTGAESAAFDRKAVDELGVGETSLMESAGRAAAQVLDRLVPSGPVVGVVGAGNNGGDALVLLRTLAAWGRRVSAILVSDRAPSDPLLHGWKIPTTTDGDLGDPGAWAAALAGAEVIVDGILGTGIQGAPRERQSRAIEAINATEATVMALDLPSGVDSASGQIAGEAVRADFTVGFGWPKLGALLSPGREYGGRVIGVEIGFPPEGEGTFGQSAITASWAHAARPRRSADTHKNAVGTLLLLAGREGMGGAAVLAARAALRAGVGLLRVASVSGNREVLQTAVPEAIFIDAGDTGALTDALARSDALAVGPGLGVGDDSRILLDRTLEGSPGMVAIADADALTLIAGAGSDALSGIAADRSVVVTPHPGEMSRLSTLDRETILCDRVGVARTFATDTGSTVLLKGLPSVVAAPSGHVQVDTVGTSDLATAGMGDVLTGVVGAFLAQGAAPAAAAALGLQYTGRAAILADRGAGMTPDDVVQRIPDALREEGPGWTDLDLPFVNFDHDAPR
jgi:ADP-dependent NAD(P)H-hydrate dehydratase / NAD(P)H-hydrate epimerase